MSRPPVYLGWLACFGVAALQPAVVGPSLSVEPAPGLTFMRARMRGRGVRCWPLSCAAAAAAVWVDAFGNLGLGQALDRWPLGDELHAAAAAVADSGLRLVTSRGRLAGSACVRVQQQGSRASGSVFDLCAAMLLARHRNTHLAVAGCLVLQAAAVSAVAEVQAGWSLPRRFGRLLGY